MLLDKEKDQLLRKLPSSLVKTKHFKTNFVYVKDGDSVTERFNNFMADINKYLENSLSLLKSNTLASAAEVVSKSSQELQVEEKDISQL